MNLEKEIIDIRKLYLKELIDGDLDKKKSADKFINNIISYIKENKISKDLENSRFLIEYLANNYEKDFLSLDNDYDLFYGKLLSMIDSWKSISEQANEWKDKYVRTYADLENSKKDFYNYQRRMVTEKSNLVIDTKWRTLSEITSLIEDLDKAKSFIKPEDQEGINLIYQKFENYLTKQEVEKVIPNKGDLFNPDNMECIMTISNQEFIGKVFDVVKSGWMVNKKIVNYPQVVVGK